MSSFEPVMPPYNASDPTARFLSSSCLDFLLIEIVPMAYRVANELEADAREREAEVSAAAGGLDGVAAAAAAASASEAAAGRGKGQAAGGTTTMDEDEERAAVSRRLEGIGYRVGQGLVERCVRIEGLFFCFAGKVPRMEREEAFG